jgi:hypothetical protein
MNSGYNVFYLNFLISSKFQQKLEARRIKKSALILNFNVNEETQFLVIEKASKFEGP